jgi:hypothetical protein
MAYVEMLAMMSAICKEVYSSLNTATSPGGAGITPTGGGGELTIVIDHRTQAEGVWLKASGKIGGSSMAMLLEIGNGGVSDTAG